MILEELMATLSVDHEVFIAHGYLWVEIGGVRYRISIDVARD